jgi:hypothetical protein
MNSALAAAPLNVCEDLNVVLELGAGRERQRLTVEGGSCLIGRADFCDVQVAGPLVYGEIHVDGASAWIESTDDHDIVINDRPCRRLSLRDGDVLRVGETTITVRVNPLFDDEQATSSADDLSQLSASELCDRIESEHADLAEFERRRLLGWEALLRQVEEVIQLEPAMSLEHNARLEAALSQLHLLADQLGERTRELAAQETAFLESAGEMKRAQDLIAARFERVLQQFQDGELRASA